MHTLLACLRDSLNYIRQVAIHTMDYVDAATTNVLSPDILPVEDLRNMPRHIESELPSMMHLPISSNNTLHFYRYNSIHVLIAEGQFLHLIDVPIQNKVKQLKIYEIFSLSVPYSNMSAQYKINHKYIGLTYDKIKAIAITDLQYRACQHDNRQFAGLMHHSNP